MVILRHIKKKDSTIEADYYPEHTNDAGHIVYDFIENKIVDRVYSKSDDDKFHGYCFYAGELLERIATWDSYKEDFESGNFKEKYWCHWV